MNFSISSSDAARAIPAGRDEGPGRFLASAALVGLVLLAGFWTLSAQFREDFLEPEYGMWMAKQDMLRQCRLGSTIILGDSRMVAAFEPKRLGDAANLALGGATPIEMYYTLRQALTCPHPPKRVILSFSPPQLSRAEYFWQRSGLFGIFDFAALEEIRRESRRTGDTVLYPPANIGDFDGILTNWLHAHHFPSYYMASIVQGMLGARWRRYQEMHDQVLEDGGYHSYGLAAGAGVASYEAEMRQFTPSPLLDAYLRRLLSFAAASGMQVDYVAAPWNEATFARLKPGFTAEVAAYLQALNRDFPNMNLLAPVSRMEDSYFGDPAHLNPQGAIRFTDDIARQLN